jgi:hypothetical protein
MTPMSVDERVAWRSFYTEMGNYNVLRLLDDLDALFSHIDHLTAEDARLITALGGIVTSLDDLIASSDGVYGLHKNGDHAPWGELTAGGQYESWLMALEDAREALPKE